jgi:DNA-binding NtrC family response regulator
MVDGVAAGPIIVYSAAMRKAVALGKRFAPLARPVALVGETGVGKRLLARVIHAESGRTGGFVAGGEGDPPAPSLLDRAQNGTLFLDDLPRLPLPSQSAVLHALDEQGLAPQGSEREILLTCRLIFASQRPLDELVDQGRLLPALRSLIGEFVIDVPPLRERFADIAALSYHFLDATREKLRGTGPSVLDPEALNRLLTYQWPGNVRELRAAVDWSYVQAAASGTDRIQIHHLPRGVMVDEANRRTVDLEGRRDLSLWAFERAGHDRKRAAELLGVHPNTIDNHRRMAGQ